jgi:hypothetical protein
MLTLFVSEKINLYSIELGGRPMKSMIQAMINRKPTERPKMSALLQQLTEQCQLIGKKNIHIGLKPLFIYFT